MRAKKSFGQHFLTNEHIAARIADALPLGSGPAPNVLEVGPGMGMLTKYLLQKNIYLKVVEADADMVAYLSGHYPELQGCIIAEDFLQLDLSQVFPNQESQSCFGPGPTTTNEQPTTNNDQPTTLNDQLHLIGNFPYNISSQIVFKMLEHRQRVPVLVGMFQKEMAQRIIAPPGGKDYGIISVLTQAFYQGEYLFSVGSGNFNPPPKVQSGVIRLVRRGGELGCDEGLFKSIVKQAFGQRRKMLRNTLKPFFKDPAILEDDFFTQRPEVLDVPAFVALAQRVAQGN